MKKSLEEILDGMSPKELDELLTSDFDASVPENILARIEDKALEKARLKTKVRRFRPWVRVAVAACLVFVIGTVGVVYAAEAKEYRAAAEFFADNGLSTEGLSREDIKAVYRDITTEHFTYEKTAEVLQRSVPGIEISQKEPTPEELAALWNGNVWNTDTQGGGNVWNTDMLGDGISYRHYSEEKLDEKLGFDVFDRSCLECYRDGDLIWTAQFSSFCVEDSVFTAAGTAVWGFTPRWSSEQPDYAWIARVDDAGKALWERQLEHGFKNEEIAAVLDNGDDTWAVISRGDFKYLCLSQYDMDGNELSFHKTQVDNRGIWNAVRLGEGYLVQLGHMIEGDTAHLAKLDREGNLIDNFIYEGKDCDYYLTDMAEFGNRVYLSAYAVPKQTDAGGRSEVGSILEHIFGNEDWDISSEELTPMIRDNYTAVLLLCDPEGGQPETFYSVKGSLGAELNVNDAEELEWNVDSVTSTYFSPYTSSFSLGGSCQVFRYTFDASGTLVNQEDTGETVPYRR